MATTPLVPYTSMVDVLRSVVEAHKNIGATIAQHAEKGASDLENRRTRSVNEYRINQSVKALKE